MPRLSTIILLGLAFLLSTATIGCDDPVGGEDVIEQTYTFDDSAEGWTGDIVDYPTYRTPEELEFVFERRSLPAELDADGMGLYFAGRNTPDDLFMYAKRKLSGLQPRANYGIEFRLTIASNSPSGCVGIGGPPGEAVRVLVGAADENGSVWVFVGTDSGFEGKTTLFYDTIQLTITG